MASFIKTPDHLTIVFDDGEVANVYNNNPNYQAVISALNDKDWDAVRDYADPATPVKRAIADAGVTSRVHIEHGIVNFDGNELHNHLTDRMLEMLEEGIDITPLALFLENLMANPSFRAVNELYGFLEASNLPITDDGCFVAYKRVREDFMDIYSGTMNNAVGEVVEMSRNAVDEDKDRTCSAGLHFCSREYLPHYGAYETNKVVMVKINPADVVAIPSDYNNAKGRTCRYEVIGELELDLDIDGNLPAEEIEGVYRDTTSGSDLDRVIVQLDDLAQAIEMFETPSEAQKRTGIDSSSISKVARGLRNRAGGYMWAYMTRENAEISLGLRD